MTRLIGQSALQVALAIALWGILAALLGVRRGRADLVRSAYAAAYTCAALLTLATGAMTWALVTHDFSVSYVAQVGSRATPTFYTIISLWGALEGSILFWGFVLSAWTAIVVALNRHRPGHLVPYATAMLLCVSVFFYALLVGPAHPFGLVSPAPADGPGPNPLLQNHPLMAVHPPLLYLGYVGMTVPFSFAIGALLAGEAGDADWIRLTRRWTLAAWIFLTAAIIAGMWWSYEVLGWGGYWAWDPVENASFMPWLTATAFLHSMMMQERRGMLKVWNVCLIVSTFLLTVLGTFLTRSGIISSVHAFARGEIGWWFLGFIAVVLVFALALVAGSSGTLRGRGHLDGVASRESVFLINNLLFAAFTFTVVLGTLFPLVAEAVRGVKVSVGAPFFNRMTLPLCALLLFFMGVGPALPWRRASRDVVRAQLLPPAAAAALAMVLALAAGARHPYALATFAFGAFALVANGREYAIGTAARRRLHGEPALVALARLVGANPRRFGGYLSHVGVVCVAVAIAASSTFRTEVERTLAPGESLEIGGYTVRLDEMWGREEPQRTVIGADLTVLRAGRDVGSLSPRMNFYPTSDQPVPTPDVRSRPSGDLYLNLMAFERDGSTATIRAISEPLVPWIWTGGGIICLGALVALRRPRRREAAAPLPLPNEPDEVPVEPAIVGAAAAPWEVRR